MKRLITLAALLAATSAFGITGDWIEDTEHSYVGLIVFYNADGTVVQRCSGSLISPIKVVTSGACTSTIGAVSARVYFQQDAGVNFDPNTGVDSVSGFPTTCAAGTLDRYLSMSAARWSESAEYVASLASRVRRATRNSGPMPRTPPAEETMRLASEWMVTTSADASWSIQASTGRAQRCDRR